ncbi:hypothetical protein [Hyphococcus sp.]|uniref:hypothetical protein n=1 Tax=Hyphococcus sp. TaxID=2038636 RepID=UPI0035C6E5ED
MDAKNEKEGDAKRLQQSLDAFTAKLEAMSALLDRMEGRLDVLYEECQRIGGSTQRTLLRQESLSQELTRLEQSLRDK